MKRFKKTLATILSFLMCLTLFSNVAHAEEFEPEQSNGTEVIVSQSEGETWSFDDEFAYDSSDLLSSYIDYRIDSVQTPVYNASSFAGDKLTGINKIIYDKAKIMISEVANGERESTICEISFDEVGLGKHFTAEDLGVESLGDDPCSLLYQKSGMADLDIKLIGRALRADCPYERYWMGLKTGLDDYQTYYTSTEVWFEGSIKFVITVSADYMGADEFTVDINKTKAVNNAINKINEILSEAESKTDMQKLEHFKNEICDLNSYNYEAAGWPSDKYGDPWQLVYVFDEDPNTNVVCEGYSKAFMYLCNKTCFSNSAINCYVVSGVTTGNHMWNIVHWSDNKNYLVDVTNCDGNGDDLFMAEPVSGTFESGYTFKFGSGELTYVYDADSKMIYGENELTYKTVVYPSLTDIFVNYDANIKTGKSIPFTVIREGGSDECRFRLDSAVNASEESILGDGYTPAYGTGNVFNITFPSEGAYTIKFSAIDSDNTEKSKVISVAVKQSSDISDYSSLVAALNSASTDENSPTVIQLAADIETTGELNVLADTYVVLDLNGYVINRGGTGSRVMTNFGNLTIIDSRPDATHNPEITYTNPIDEITTVSVSGGIITGGTASHGAGIYIKSTGKLILEGGNIALNKATQYGGGVYVDGGSFVMNGGSIYGNTSDAVGGGVYLCQTLMKMSGDATIKNNKALNGDGGGVYLVRTTDSLIMSGNSSITGNEATRHGGGVKGNAESTLTITENAAIEDNECGGAGGGVEGCYTTMSDNASISNNICHGGRGGAGISTGQITVSDNAAISGNRFEAENYSSWGGAGGIYTEGKITMTGGTISNNYSCADGGGVGLYYSGVLEISGGSIVNNDALRRGGGIYQPGDYGGHIEVFGTPVIANNTQGEDHIASNVFFYRNDMIHVIGALKEGAHIGITTNGNPSQSAPAYVTYLPKDNSYGYSLYNTENPSEFFFSDAGYIIFLDDSGEARAVTPWQHIGIRLSKGETVVLTEDAKAIPNVDLNIYMSSYTSATIDLNGHILDGGGTARQIFDIGGTEVDLTIIDSNPNSEHSLAVTYIDPVTNETITVKGGILTGAYSDGILAENGSSITMKGGSIVGNYMGLRMFGSTFNLEGGSICGNASSIDGGGVWVYYNGKLNMSGGSITGNTSTCQGGGVFLANNQQGCTSELHLSGGSITNNVSYGNGGAIFIGNHGYLGISGNPIISDNKKIETVDGVETKVVNNIVHVFHIEGEMKDGASVALTTGAPDSYPELYAYNFTTYNEEKNPADYFVTDNPDAFICLYDGSVRALAHNTITFDANGGTGTMEGLTDYCGAYTLPECSFTAPEGLRFKNWMIDTKTYNPGKSLEFFSTAVINANWENIPTYTVTFDVNGGNALDSNTLAVYQNYPYGAMPVPTKQGYIFDGWFTAKTDGTQITSSDVCTDYITLYAHWSPDPNTAYKVTHSKQGLDGEYTELPEEENLTGTTGESVSPAVKNYEGFSSPEVQTETIKEDGSTLINYQYTRNSYTLTWDYDGGTASGEYTTGIVKYEAPIIAPSLTKPGYTFAGWDVTVPAAMPAKDLTIKAKWSANTNTAYKVEHYKQGLDGKYTASPEVENNKGTTGTSVRPSLKSYEGFAAPAVQNGTIKADGSLVIKYYYARNSYKITWNLDGGKASGTYTSGTVKYGASITAPTVTKDGYIFDGWNAKVVSTMPSNDLTYTAKWQKKEKTEEELVTDFVKRFYKEVLGRSDSAIEKDADGINDWVTKLLTKEKTGAEVAKGFVNSKEFKNRNVNNEEFVRIMYVSFFGREPDEGGYKGWLDKLNAGTSREDVLAGFTNSQEFKNLCAKYNINPGKLETSQSRQNNQQTNNNKQNNNNQSGQRPPLKLDSSNVDITQLDKFVERLYEKVLGRKSDKDGKKYWMDAIIEGHDDKGNVYDAAIAIRKGFFESKEYLNKNRNDDEFLTDLYWAFFNREPDADGYAYWQDKMKNEGYTRQRVIDEGFGHSKEFKNLLTSYGFKIIE